MPPTPAPRLPKSPPEPGELERLRRELALANGTAAVADVLAAMTVTALDVPTLVAPLSPATAGLYQVNQPEMVELCDEGPPPPFARPCSSPSVSRWGLLGWDAWR